MTIRCNCTDNNGTVVNPVRWYDPNGTRLVTSGHNIYVPGTPYYRRAPNNANVALVIPAFNESYNGTYTCGGKVNRGPPDPPSAAINLTIGGKLMIHV